MDTKVEISLGQSVVVNGHTIRVDTIDQHSQGGGTLTPRVALTITNPTKPTK